MSFNLHSLHANAYIYCWICPTAFDDIEGTRPKLSVVLTDIISFIQNINNRIKDGITAGINKLTEKWNKLTNNWKNSLKIRYNTFIDKLEYFSNYPDAVINDTLSKIFNKDVNIRFRLIEYIRKKTNIKIDLGNFKTDIDSGDNTKYNKQRNSPVKKIGKYVSENGKVIGVVITEIFTCLDLQEIAQKLKINFSFTDFADYMQKKVEIYRQYFDSLIDTAAKDYAADISGFIATILGMIPNLSIVTSSVLNLLPYVVNLINDYSGRYISTNGSLIMALFDMIMGGIVDLGGLSLDASRMPIIGILFTSLSDYLYNIDTIREKAEFIAYNWFYLLFVDWSIL